jgi:L-amino acid N-acyltransferase YncA
MRPGSPDDVEAINEIYAAGIEAGDSTAELELPTADDFVERIDDDEHPNLVCEVNGRILGWAGVAPYDNRSRYTGIGDFGVYVARWHRRRGVGSLLMETLGLVAEDMGFHKLLAYIPMDTPDALPFFVSSDFKFVGLHGSHAKTNGALRDMVVMERPLGPTPMPAWLTS